MNSTNNFSSMGDDFDNLVYTIACFHPGCIKFCDPQSQIRVSGRQIAGRQATVTQTSDNSQTGIRKLMTAGEVAQALNIRKSGAYQLMQWGEIPTVHISKAVRVRPEDLDAFIETHRSKLKAYYWDEVLRHSRKDIFIEKFFIPPQAGWMIVVFWRKINAM